MKNENPNAVGVEPSGVEALKIPKSFEGC